LLGWIGYDTPVTRVALSLLVVLSTIVSAAEDNLVRVQFREVDKLSPIRARAG